MPDNEKPKTLAELNAGLKSNNTESLTLKELNAGLKKKVPTPGAVDSPDYSKGIPGDVLMEDLVGSTSESEPSISALQGGELSELARTAQVAGALAPQIPTPQVQAPTVPVSELGETLPPVITGTPPAENGFTGPLNSNESLGTAPFREEEYRERSAEFDKSIRQNATATAPKEDGAGLVRYLSLDLPEDSEKKDLKPARIFDEIDLGTENTQGVANRDILDEQFKVSRNILANERKQKNLETSLTKEDNEAIIDWSKKYEDKYFKTNVDDLNKFDTEASVDMEVLKESLPEDMSDLNKERIVNGVAMRVQGRYEERKVELEKDNRILYLKDKAGISDVKEFPKIKTRTISETRGLAPKYKNLTDEESLELSQYLNKQDVEREGYIIENRTKARLGEDRFAKRVNDEANQLYSPEEVTEKSLVKELEDLHESKASQLLINEAEDALIAHRGSDADKIWDPVTKKRIGMDEASPELVRWDKRVKEESVKLSRTNTKEDLVNIQSKAYSEMKYLETLSLIDSPEFEDKKAEFEAASRALDFNKSITNIERNAWTRVVESATEGLGFDFNSDEDDVIDYHQMMNNNGLGLTDDEKDRVEQRFIDKVGSTVGGSIPVMMEIMFWTAATGGIGATSAIERNIAKFASKFATGEKSAKTLNGIAKVVSNATNREMQFQLAGQSGGAGESLGAEAGTALAGNLAFLGNSKIGRLLRTSMITLVAKPAGETIEEYSGEIWTELMKDKTFAEAVGTVVSDDPFEKLALTYITGAIFSVGSIKKDWKNSKIVQEMGEAIVNSDSKSPIVKMAKDLNTEFSKPEGAKEAIKESLGKEGDDREGAVIAVKEVAGETSNYSVDEVLRSDKQVIEDLSDPKFVEDVKSGKKNLDVQNPSPEVKVALEESGLLGEKKQDVKEEITPETKVDETPVEGEQQVTESVETKIEQDAKIEETKVDETKVEETKVLEEPVADVPKTGTTKKSIKETIAETLEADLNEGKIAPESVEAVKTRVEELRSEVESRKAEDEAFRKDAESRQVDEDLATVKADEKQHITEEAAKEEAYQQQLDEEAELKYKEIENSNEGIIAEYLRRGVQIDPKIAERETGVKVGVGKDINPKWVKKGGKSIEAVAEDILADELVLPQTDMQEVRNIIIDIVKHGSAKSYLESIGGVKPVKAKTTKPKPESVKKAEPIKVEKIKESKLTKAAELIRSKKFAKSFDDMSRLSSLPVDILFKKAINTSLEAAALTMVATREVSKAISSGITVLKETKWYKQLSDNGKKAAEDIFASNAQEQLDAKAKEFAEEVKKTKAEETKPKVKEIKPKAKSKAKTEPKPKTEAEKKLDPAISRQTARAIEMESDPEVQKKLKEIGKYKKETHKEVSKYVDDLIKVAGPEGAIVHVKSKGDLNEQIAVLTEAGAVMVMESKAQLKEAVKNGNDTAQYEAKKAMERGYGYINEASQYKTKAGQIISYTKESYNKYPSVYFVAEMNKFEGANKGMLDDSYSETSDGDVETVKEAIQDTQETLIEEIGKTVDGEMDKILRKIDSLESENKSLSDKIESLSKKREASKEGKKDKIKKIQANRKLEVEAFKKASKVNSGETSVGLFLMNNGQIKALKNIVASYIAEGVTRSDIIISKVFNDVKDLVGNKKFTKDHVRNIAEQITEFNAMVTADLGKKKVADIEKVFAKETKTTPESIEKQVVNQAELWGEYQKSVLNKIKTSLSSKSRKQKALLEKLDSEISSHISGVIKAKKEEVTKEELTKDSVFDTVADLISNQEKIVEIYGKMLESDSFTDAEKATIEGEVKSLFDGEFNLSPKEVKQVLSQSEGITGKKLKEVVRDHYKGRNAYARTLAQTIAAKTDLSKEASEVIAKSLEAEISGEIEATVKKELKKFLKKGKTVAELKQEKLDGTLNTEGEKDLSNRLKSSEDRKIEKKLVAAVKMGALSSGIEVTQAFEGKFGFKTLPTDVKNKLLSLVDRLADIEMDVQKSMLDEDGNVIEEFVDSKGNPMVFSVKRVDEISRLQNEFNTLLESQVPANLAIALRETVSFSYISMLSGPMTAVRAAVGGYGSGLVGTLSYNVGNITNLRALGQGYKALWKSFPAAWRRAIVARKTGQDFFGASAYREGVSGDKRSRVESALLRGLGEAVHNGDYSKATGKLFGQMGKMIHFLGAMDAFMVTLGGNFIGATEEYKEVAKKQKKNPSMNVTVTELLKDKKIREAAYESIASEEFVDLEKNVRDEVKADIANGKVKKSKEDSEVAFRLKSQLGILGSITQSPRKMYKVRRIQELREADLKEHFLQGVHLAKDATMMSQLDGNTGRVIGGLQNSLSIKTDDETHVVVGKGLMNAVFKFVRITGAVLIKSMNNIPVLGIANILSGPGHDPITGEAISGLKGKLKANPLLVKQRIITNLLVSAAATTVLLEMFKYDDDEEKFVLDPDRRIDVRGFGFEGQAGQRKSKKKNEDWVNISFSMSKNEEGEFDNYLGTYLIPEVAAIASTVSALSDDYKADVGEKGIWKRQDSPGSYFTKIAGNNLKIFTESSFSSVGKMIKTFSREDDPGVGFMNVLTGLIVDNTRPLVNPASFKSVTSFIQSSMELNQKKSDYGSVFSQLTRGAYGLDYFLKNERTDVFGNPYPVESDADRFLELIGHKSKRSDDFRKTAGVLFKFDEGLNISKFSTRDYKRGGTFKVKTKAYGKTFYKEYRSMDDNIADEILKLQEDEFHRLTLEKNVYIEKKKTQESLEKYVQKLQARSKDFAERAIVKKYKDTDKIKRLKKKK